MIVTNSGNNSLIDFVNRNINKNKNIYFISENLIKAQELLKDFINLPNFKILDSTDISIDANFNKEDILIIDNIEQILTRLLKHKINYCSNISK